MKKSYLIPEGLDLDVFTYPEKVAYIVDRIYRHWNLTLLKDGNDFERSRCFVPINSKALEKAIGARYATRSLQELREKNIVKRKSYEIGSHPFAYNLRSPYLEMMSKSVTFDDYGKSDEKYLLQRQREIAGLDGESYKRSCANLNLVSLIYSEEDYRLLKEFVREQCRLEYENDGYYWKEYRKKCSMLHRRQTRTWVDRFEDKWLSIEYNLAGIVEGSGFCHVPFYSKDAYGRFHHYLTSFPRELRPFVRFDGKPIKAFDIKSSQVIFFILALRDRMFENPNFSDIIDEIRSFYPDRAACLRGITKRKLDAELRTMARLLKNDFYRSLMQVIDYKCDRASFKDEFFQFLYGPDRGRNRIQNLFLNQFPAVYVLMWQMKNLGEMNVRGRELELELRKRIHDAHPGIESRELNWRVRTERNEIIKQDSSLYYGKLPCEMQRIESDFIFSRVLPQLAEPFLPLHDAILVKANSRTNIARIIQKEFREVKISAGVSTEPWTTELPFSRECPQFECAAKR